MFLSEPFYPVVCGQVGIAGYTTHGLRSSEPNMLCPYALCHNDMHFQLLWG